MLLALDVGNTNIVVGLLEGTRILKTWRVSTHPLVTSDELRIKISSILSFEKLEWGCWSAVAVSSVVPSLAAVLKKAFDGFHVLLIDHKSPFSFEVAANPPDQVGADRLVNAEAALREYGSPVIIVDSGTATTLCAVSRDKKYLGGAIMPGIELSTRALTLNTAKLFSVELLPPSNVIGGNTQEALRSGLILGYASMIDGMIARFKQALGEPNASVIATGGVSQLLKGLTTQSLHFDPDLTLKGIAYVHASSLAR